MLQMRLVQANAPQHPRRSFGYPGILSLTKEEEEP